MPMKEQILNQDKPDSQTNQKTDSVKKIFHNSTWIPSCLSLSSAEIIAGGHHAVLSLFHFSFSLFF